MAEEANRVWRSGRLFARIRAEKDGNRKWKRDTAHDGVGSSGAGEPFKHCSGSAFLLFEMLNTELRSRWQRLRSAAGGGKSKQGLAQRSAFLQEYEQKKAETARGCVTRFTMPLVQAGQGEPFKHCLCSAFLLFETLNTELRSRWQMLRSAAGGGRSEQGLAQRSAFCENTSRKRREPQVEA